MVLTNESCNACYQISLKLFSVKLNKKTSSIRVLHFILGKANKNRPNGVNQVIAGLAKYCVRHGCEVKMVGKSESVTTEGELISRDGFSVLVFSRFNKAFRISLYEAIEWADVVHMHGVFNPWNLWVAHICNRLKKPYVITLHDGLAAERIQQSGKLKKKIFLYLFQKRHLERASGIHVLTEEEATELLAFSKPSNIFCVPNGVDLEDYPSSKETRTVSSREICIGYLGRLSPEKNIEALCMAFAATNADGNLKLKLAGPDSSYLQELLSKYGHYGVEWVGAKYGTEKVDFIHSIDLFVHPSLCDVFSIAAMEVLALGTPLLITRTAKTSYFYNRQAFFMCEPTTFGLERGLLDTLKRSSEWPSYSLRGRQLIEDTFNWSAAAQQMINEYERIIKLKKI